jgi:hypothetical protein
MEEWQSLRDYPGYAISTQGRVANESTGKQLAIVHSRQGYAFVGLMHRTTQVKRGVALLVCKTFLEVPEPSFDTPIHLNGDLPDCTLDNLEWRPRWFAMRYAHQFKHGSPEDSYIREKKTREVLSIWDAVKKYGLLYTDVLMAINNHTYVFPTMQIFEWVRSV